MTEALTARQIEMIEAYERYGTIPAVARATGLAEGTVIEHLRRARRRLNVRFTIEAVWALRARRDRSATMK